MGTKRKPKVFREEEGKEREKKLSGKKISEGTITQREKKVRRRPQSLLS